MTSESKRNARIRRGEQALQQESARLLQGVRDRLDVVADSAAFQLYNIIADLASLAEDDE